MTIHESILDAKSASGNSSSFGDMTSQNLRGNERAITGEKIILTCLLVVTEFFVCNGAIKN